ncbi:CHAD domain-containing protein [Rhizobium sp. NRK18]|uniref:CHAD domain-containing protein n=1 Tax=Rhizobium sp. NRK18 TaxID=2964667 RepID=UPI0021C477DA|nr:CHAD domain-containing protein [Rhizobium sp. NRK18]MCQ2002688.1 CHAD domain-containing protein [Rhizobium sp. NRK18]
MSYQLRPEKSFTADVTAVAREQIAKAIALLSGPPESIDTGIHQARRCFKRIRSLYRLVGSDARKFQKRENARFREIAASLAPYRDSAAIIGACTALHQAALSGEEAAALDRIRQALIEQHDGRKETGGELSERIAAAKAACGEALEAVGDLAFDDGRKKTARRLAAGWEKTLTGIAEALEACRNSSDPSHYHALRKRVQDYWRQSALLGGLWPSAMSMKRTEAKRLADTLGEANDLAVLSALADSGKLPAEGDDLIHLKVAVNRNLFAMQRDCVTLATSLFPEPPAVESRVIGLLWYAATARGQDVPFWPDEG